MEGKEQQQGEFWKTSCEGKEIPKMRKGANAKVNNTLYCMYHGICLFFRAVVLEASEHVRYFEEQLRSVKYFQQKLIFSFSQHIIETI